jgi:hypothetical protein
LPLISAIRHLCLLGFLVGAVPAVAAEPPTHFYCNLKAFTPAEREVHSQLSQELLAAVRETVELENGFALRMDIQKAPLVTLARWVDGERRCCPFLRFEIAKEPQDGPVWLRLSGAPGVKDFLRAELGLGTRR